MTRFSARFNGLPTRLGFQPSDRCGVPRLRILAYPGPLKKTTQSANKTATLSHFCQWPTHPPQEKLLKTKALYDDIQDETPKIAEKPDISAILCHFVPFPSIS